MENQQVQTTQTAEKTETVALETQPVSSTVPSGEGEGEELAATVAVEPQAEKPAEEATSLVPAVAAVVVAVVGLVAVVKKVLAK